MKEELKYNELGTIYNFVRISVHQQESFPEKN